MADQLFAVWDEINESEAHASQVSACNPFEAAGKYAQEDVDGNTDGIYTRGHVICARDTGGSLTRVLVTVEYDPVYFAKPAPLKKGPDHG